MIACKSLSIVGIQKIHMAYLTMNLVIENTTPQLLLNQRDWFK